MAITKVTRTLLSTGIVDNSNATAITIDSSENVGIGTTSPSAPLHILKSATGINVATDMLKLSSVDTNPAYYVGFQAQRDNSAGQGLNILTTNVSGTVSESMRIDSSGNVGIGTTSPGTQLTLNKNDNNFLQIRSSDTGNAGIYFGRQNDSVRGAIVYDNSNESIQFLNNNYVERMRIDSSGNIGIGTSSPSSLGTGIPTIDLKGNSSSQSDRAGGIRFTRYDGTSGMAIYNADGASYIESHSTYPLLITTNGTERMRIDSSGNVGIGTSSPSKSLHIKGDNSALLVSSADQDIAFIGPRGSSGDGADEGLLYLKDGGTTKVQLDANGNSYLNGGSVGIGTSSPQEMLTVNSGTTGSSFIQVTNTTLGTGDNAGLYVGIQSDEDGYIGMRSNQPLAFATNNTERMRISTNGRLLVGGSTDRGGNICVGGTSTTARVIPQTDNVGYVGQSDFRWQAIYAVNGSIQTSDEREKTEIKKTTLGLNFIKDLKPVSYKWIDGEQQNKGKDEREHQGLIAQQVAETVEKHGVNKNDFGGLDIQKTEKYDDFYGMSYDQLIAPLIKAIQEQQTIIDDLKTRIETLENV
jgi:hypothetical protein